MTKRDKKLLRYCRNISHRQEKKYMRKMFSTSCCHIPYLYLSNIFWKHLSEEMQYGENFEMRIHIYKEN